MDAELVERRADVPNVGLELLSMAPWCWRAPRNGALRAPLWGTAPDPDDARRQR
jgi:hypothetical protein